MAGKRKRTRSKNPTENDQKRQKIAAKRNSKDPVIKHALLAQYYPQVFSLRDYLLSKLPTTSKARRKKLSFAGRRSDSKQSDEKLARFLDETLVGVCEGHGISHQDRWRQWTAFSQKADESAFANLSGIGVYSQSEIIDFAIWLLFSKSNAGHGRVQHLLCQGYKRDATSRFVGQEGNVASNIPGVVSEHPNSHVISMKAWPWPQVLAMLGNQGEKIMIDLVLDTGIFLAISGGMGTYHQLSGQPLNELPSLLDGTRLPSHLQLPPPCTKPRSPSSINFVRSRMMYARATLNAQGSVRFGLRHIHVLNRYPLGNNQSLLQKVANQNQPSLDPNTARVMRYIFPRQFGLHNPFTSEVDSRQTVQPFKDYTLREEEINKLFPADANPKIPKRLRGKAAGLVRKLQVLHSRCPYKSLLDYYCPKPSRSTIPKPSQVPEPSARLRTQLSISSKPSTSSAVSTKTAVPPSKYSMLDHSSPTSMVAAFCRAVLSHIIPSDFWGGGHVKEENEQVFYQNIDQFIGLRRFETMSLHEVSQGIKISEIEWLGPPVSAKKRMSQSDFGKRWEIFHEYLYYLFDSLLIPLLRANFHITESNAHRNRLFYFRHDVWRSIADPALTSLKITMFEEIKLEKALRILDSRSLAFSQIRLLPKETGVRPIMNLKRRSTKKGLKNMLGPSINSVLTPVFNVLSYEKTMDPARLGSTLFSVGDLYTKLKAFKSSLDRTKRLYFAKVDVKSAFDTIPQDAVLKLISSLPSEPEYRISKHVEIKPGENYRSDSKSKPIRKWTALARPFEDFETFEETLESGLAVGRKNMVFIENIVSLYRDKKEILSLLIEHVQRNMVKIGKKFYRQKEGIPQGSILSSLLCNYFYADLEAQHLSFLQCGNSLLLRLVDDFLLITTEPSHAKRFLQIMHDGLPAYGVRVSPDKTLVNFEVTINEKKLARLVGEHDFPYCGSFIDTKTLDISKDRARRKDMAIVDSLTVEFSRVPGKTFQRKILNTFKIQAHAMFLDTAYNALNTVLSNVHSAFVETATKMCAYIRCLPGPKKPGSKLVIKTFTDLVNLAFVLMKSKARNKKNVGYKCVLSKIQVEGLAVKAFSEVLVKKQSRYKDVISFLKERAERLRLDGKGNCEMGGRMKGVIGNVEKGVEI